MLLASSGERDPGGRESWFRSLRVLPLSVRPPLPGRSSMPMGLVGVLGQSVLVRVDDCLGAVAGVDLW